MTKLAFIAGTMPEARAALAQLTNLYGSVPIAQADIVVALGGDGLMLQVLHETMALGKPIYGMNRGSIGFLMNDYSADGLVSRLERAETAVIHPLQMSVIDMAGHKHTALAINEVSLLRETRQSAKLQLSVDGKVRLEELICDGVIVATPAGSTAYNLSAHGPVLPIDSKLLALTPISAFRPRRWRGALLAHRSHVRIDVLEHQKRPVSAVADHTEVRSVVQVDVIEREDVTIRMLFDKGRSLEERVLAEQFSH